MDWLTFITSMTGALAWPLALLAIAILFRKALVALLPSLQQVEYGQFKVKFTQELSEAKARADRAALPIPQEPTPPGPAPAPAPAPEPAAMDRVMLATVSPRDTVLQAWIQVEQAMWDAMRDVGLGLWKRRSEPERLLKAGRITPEVAALISKLRALRNDAAHQPDFALDPQHALAYAELSERVIAALTRQP